MLKVPPTDRVTVIGYDWHLDDPLPRLDTPEGQAAIEPLVEVHDVIILDNRSCLFDPLGEKDPEAWQPAQDWILSLRRRGKTVIIIHHANKQGGSRGHSKAEDFLDLCIELARPDDYDPSQLARFQVNFTKARGIRDPRAAMSFIATLTPTGWVTEEVLKENEQTALNDLTKYLTECEGTAKPKSFNEAFKDVRGNRNTMSKMWNRLLERRELLQEKGVYRLVTPSEPASNPPQQEQLDGIREEM